jgi:hypothetical protein
MGQIYFGCIWLLPEKILMQLETALDAAYYAFF